MKRRKDEFISPRVSILVLCHNSKKYLKICFRSLITQTYTNYEVVLVDNNSTDGSIEFIAKNFPHVRIISFNKNYGYAGAYNRAVKKIDSEYVAFLNPDVEVDPNWLKELMIAVQESGEEVKIWGSKILFYDNRDIIQNVGGFISPSGSAVCPELFKRNTHSVEKRRFVGYVQGSTMLVERKAFLQLGGFDPDYFMYQEEVDLCWRAWLMGYKVLYVPTAIVYHVSGLYQSSGTPFRIFSGNPFMTYYDTRNQKANIIKNFSLSRLPRAIIVSLAYDVLSSLHALNANNREVIRAILRAYLDCFRNFSPILSKRKLIQMQRKVSDKELERMGIILSLRECIREYIRAKKLYSNIQAYKK
jgi:GT2 family glycosyltransferase